MKPQLLIRLALFGTIPATSMGALVRLDETSFADTAAVIKFDEPGYPLNTVNPVYNVNTVDKGVVKVSFGGFFAGQSATGSSVITLDDNTPDGPLSLDGAAPDTFITNDGANPTSPVLSGTPRFNGPISFLFDVDVAAVGLTGGFFDNVGSMSIEAYRRDGTVIGSVSNTITGIEFFGLADSSGQDIIGGISFYITGDEPAGFGIDNVTFGSAAVVVDPDVDDPSVPEPGSFSLLALGVLGLLKRRSRCC